MIKWSRVRFSEPRLFAFFCKSKGRETYEAAKWIAAVGMGLDSRSSP
jgi:hypothetical protein